jgi:hypothetical protein
MSLEARYDQIDDSLRRTVIPKEYSEIEIKNSTLKDMDFFLCFELIKGVFKCDMCNELYVKHGHIPKLYDSNEPYFENEICPFCGINEGRLIQIVNN